MCAGDHAGTRCAALPSEPQIVDKLTRIKAFPAPTAQETPAAAFDRYVDVGLDKPTVHLMQSATVQRESPRHGAMVRHAFVPAINRDHDPRPASPPGWARARLCRQGASSTKRTVAASLPIPDLTDLLADATPCRPGVPVILLVDDNIDARVMYKMCLEFEGFACVTAHDGLDAITRLGECRPALILMDAAMPGMDGWEATLRIKADPVTRDIPIYMLTAHAFPEHRRHAVEVGADGFLAKPILPDDLGREVRRALNLPEVPGGPCC